MTGKVGIIIGSGYAALNADKLGETRVDTPYGPPSSAIMELAFGDVAAVCIARHGEQQAIAPHEVNYRANVWALHKAGARQVIGVNVVGAIAEDFAPGDLGVPDQLIDYTSGRPSSFVLRGETVRYIDFTQPFDKEFSLLLKAAAKACGYRARTGIYGVTNGPRLETAAEIDRMQRDGCAMVGMTAMPEASLARELDIEYAILAVAVNYAAGRSPHGSSIHAELAQCLSLGMARVTEVLSRLVPELGVTM